MATTPQLQVYIDNDRDPMFWVYENDSGQNCDFEPHEDEDIARQVADLAALSTGLGITQIIRTANVATWACTVTSAVLAAVAYWHAISGDDFIGIATVPRGELPSTNPKSIMNEKGPTTRGLLYMQFRPK